MNVIELYIDGKLCDTSKDFGVRLNRQLLNPAELNAKDAQYSYSVTLPATAANNAAFAYSNVEETKDKFNRLYLAEVYVNSVRVFKGNFRPSEISARGHKGNLYIPAAKSIKDIFGDTKLTDNPAYRIEFKDFAEYISKYNKAAKDGPQMAIFPYVLYGVLPKVPLTNNKYSDRLIWDDSVRMGMQDLAPSINPLLMLQHIFSSHGFRLKGTAFDDERLTRLYMSYKNESDYVQPWNYGQHAKIKLSGAWASAHNKRTGASARKLERGVYETTECFLCDLFDATNTKVEVKEDTGGNVIYKEVQDEHGKVWTQCQVHIPTSGFYKVALSAELNIPYNKDNSANRWRETDPITGVQHLCSNSQHSYNNLFSKMYEIRLLRDWGKGDFGLSGANLDGTFFRNNLPQNTRYATVRDFWGRESANPDFNSSTDIPKHFPQVDENGQINFIDAAQDSNIVLGFAFGRKETGEYQNPRDTDTQLAQIHVAKPALSWDSSQNTDKPTRLAVNSPGYWKYGKIGSFDNEDDNPNTNIDYSEGERITGKVLDEHGNPIAPEVEGEAVDNVILFRFPLNRYFTYMIETEASYTGFAYVHAGVTSVIERLKVEFVDGVAIFSTSSFGVFEPSPYLTLYLATDDFNVDGTLTISRIIQQGSEDIIDWEVTDKYRIKLNNAPQNFAKRTSDLIASGRVNAVVWLEAGELLTLAAVSQEGRYRVNGMHSTYGWVTQEVNFDLDIQPFRVDADWLKVGLNGNGTGVMDWDDPVNFDTDSIDLVKFLPADIKTDDFIENFCKAFNLRLSQTEIDSFTLDVKRTKAAVSPLYINLDGLASVKGRSNSPLGLPSLYKIGFTVDQEEEGYAMTGDDGGGSFETGAVEESIVEQKSNFSYNWFKDINYTVGGSNAVLPLPIISKAEVWNPLTPYPDAMAKRFTQLAARFWYYDDLLNGLGANFKFNKKPLSVAKVSNSLSGLITLNYKDDLRTILGVYFTVLVNSSSHYTELEGYLTPEEYERLDGSIMAMFNGDQYYVAEISGYDPLGRNKAKVKLIRKI